MMWQILKILMYLDLWTFWPLSSYYYKINSRANLIKLIKLALLKPVKNHIKQKVQKKLASFLACTICRMPNATRPTDIVYNVVNGLNAQVLVVQDPFKI